MQALGRPAASPACGPAVLPLGACWQQAGSLARPDPGPAGLFSRPAPPHTHTHQHTQACEPHNHSGSSARPPTTAIARQVLPPIPNSHALARLPHALAPPHPHRRSATGRRTWTPASPTSSSRAASRRRRQGRHKPSWRSRRCGCSLAAPQLTAAAGGAATLRVVVWAPSARATSRRHVGPAALLAGAMRVWVRAAAAGREAWLRTLPAAATRA